MSTTTTDNPALLDDWLRPLVQAFQPSPRRRLLLDIARALRAGQQLRIRAQQNPDGSAYAPRRLRARAQASGPMFQGLAKAKHLKVRATPNGAGVGYHGRAAAVARVHHDGLAEPIRPGGPMIQYARRRLLGVTPADRATAQDHLLAHIQGATSP